MSAKKIATKDRLDALKEQLRKSPKPELTLDPPIPVDGDRDAQRQAAALSSRLEEAGREIGRDERKAFLQGRAQDAFHRAGERLAYAEIQMESDGRDWAEAVEKMTATPMHPDLEIHAEMAHHGYEGSRVDLLELMDSAKPVNRVFKPRDRSRDQDRGR